MKMGMLVKSEGGGEIIKCKQRFDTYFTSEVKSKSKFAKWSQSAC